MRNVLAWVKEKGTLDELGIGQLRDIYSNLLFPGFSTIQTNARYFLAVPKIIRDWGDQTPAFRRRKPLQKYLQEEEDALAAHLVENYEALERKPEGVIGHTRVDKGGVLRRPSSAYWSGLRVFGIVRTDLSLAEFCRGWGVDAAFDSGVSSEEGADDEQFSRTVVRRPPRSMGPWPEGITLDLDATEADFLATRFKSGGDPALSVAAQLLRTQQLAKPTACVSFEGFSEWAKSNTKLSTSCRSLVQAAWRFSLFVEGAHIVFNQLMAKRLGHAPLAAEARELWDDWKERSSAEGIFGPNAVHELTAVHADGEDKTALKCSSFLVRWNQAMVEGRKMSDVQRLVEDRALETKDNRSLLRRAEGLRTTSDWYGMKALDYRWATASRMLRDVHEGLHARA